MRACSASNRSQRSGLAGERRVCCPQPEACCPLPLLRNTMCLHARVLTAACGIHAYSLLPVASMRTACCLSRMHVS